MRSRRLLLLTAAALGLAAAPAHARTVWLCLPGERIDPCTPGLSTTVYSPTLHKLRVVHPSPIKRPAIDCFYVYPTVSDQKRGNATLRIDPEERSIALYQAARYSQYCRVFAPMYRQVTLAALFDPSKYHGNGALALADVRAAFKDYLEHYNQGRGFVLIGHSQGSFVLRALMARDVDPKPAVRRRLLSAILLGGNVLVKPGRGIGGDFKHIPACRSERQLGCVIAWSTFDQPPPPDSLFGRAPKGMQVLCTNPAALAGTHGILDPISPSKPFDPQSTLAAGIALLNLPLPHPRRTVWVSVPGAYTAHCSSAGGANVLQIAPRHGAPTPNPSPTKEWGLHLLDANIALGNLLAIVKAETAAFVGR